jgi:hypothetical protein
MGYSPNVDPMSESEKLNNNGQPSVTHVLNQKCYLCPGSRFKTWVTPLVQDIGNTLALEQ